MLYAQECGDIYAKFSNAKEYSIRIEPNIERYGCKVIPLYSYLIQNNYISIMDAIENEQSILENLLSLSDNHYLMKLLNNDQFIQDSLLENTQDKRVFSNLSYLLKTKLNSSKIKSLKKNSFYIQYFTLSAFLAKDKKEAIKFYNKLSKNIEVDKITYFGFLVLALSKDYDSKYLLDNFITLKKSLSKTQLNMIILYPENIIYLLYPPKEDMHLYGTNIKIKQKRFQKMMIDLYKKAFYSFKASSLEKKNELALKFISLIYPYIVENKNYNRVEKVLSDLIETNLITNIFLANDNNPCSKKLQDSFALLFANDRINELIKFKQRYYSLYEKFLYPNEPVENKSIFSLFYVVDVYKKFHYNELKVFDNLLKNFSHNIYANVVVLHQLDNIGYFQKVIKTFDYDRWVQASDDDLNGMSAQKYRYILTTSYPSQSSYTVVDYLLSGNTAKAKDALTKLYAMDIYTLQRHTFTSKEKALYWIDKADWAITGISIAAAPFTGGASLGYLAIKQGAKQGTKVVLKRMARKLAIKSRKLFNKGITLARKGRSSIYKSVGKIRANSFRNSVEKAERHFDIFSTSVGVGSAVAFYFLIPTELQSKTLCEE